MREDKTMATLFFRPTPRDGNKRNQPWKVKGPWGEKEYPPMSRMALYDQLRNELIDSKLLPPDAPRPTNRYRDHITMLVIASSWDGSQWLKDKD
jgi:hypothetical protein